MARPLPPEVLASLMAFLSQSSSAGGARDDVELAMICGCADCQAFLTSTAKQAAAQAAPRRSERFEFNIDLKGPTPEQIAKIVEKMRAVDARFESKPTSTAPEKPQEEIVTMTTSTENTTAHDIAVDRTGDTLVVPSNISLTDAIAALTRRAQEEDQTIAVEHKFDMTVAEGARLFVKALNDLHGFVSPSLGVTMVAIDVAPGVTETVPWGALKVPGIDGKLSPELYPVNGLYNFCFTGSVKGRDKAKVQAIADHMRKIAGSDSLYRGKALRVSFPDRYSSLEDILPRFIDVSAGDESKLIFSRDVGELVETTLFTPIEHTKLCRSQGISLKRGILLEGPYGVGKTLTATVTAKKCIENGWTFILLDDVSKLNRAIAFARNYEPAVIFAEDIDQVLKNVMERNDKINGILNEIDGLESKGSEVITVLTTNNVEDITQAMLRPGRLDTVIPVRAPDAEAAVRLVRSFAGSRIARDEDLTGAGAMLAGMIPAVIGEVVERSKLSAIRRAAKTGSDPQTIVSRDLELAVQGMAQHLQLLEPKEEDLRSDMERAAEVLGDKLAEALTPKALTNGASKPASTNGTLSAHS